MISSRSLYPRASLKSVLIKEVLKFLGKILNEFESLSRIYLYSLLFIAVDFKGLNLTLL